MWNDSRDEIMDFIENFELSSHPIFMEKKVNLIDEYIKGLRHCEADKALGRYREI